MALLAATVAATARPVGMERARRLVEEHFFSPALCVSPDVWTELYVFAPAEGTGFVIVSADDCTRPVLGYSYVTSFAIDDMPPHVAGWIEGYRHEIADLRKAGATPSPAVQAMWQQPKSGRLEAVEPMMTTTWNQSPWYNAECPWSATDSAHAVTGCVATATAQVMKYWNHPAKGHGQHGYNCQDFGWQQVSYDTLYLWDSMPDALTWTSTPTEVHAVAQLMYHVGVAVNMGYGVHSSGAYTTAYGSYNLPSSERALRETFRYSPLLTAVWKQYYSDNSWDSLMRHEIVHGRPILYSGSDNSGGHAFVLDGCDSTGMFHVNWGWGGWCDGYYTIDSLSPAPGGVGGNSTYTFNLNNAAVIGIQPSYGNDTVAIVNAVSCDSTMGSVFGNGIYVPYEDEVTVSAIAAPGYRFDGWKSGSIVNPVVFTVNGDFYDTALFVPVGRDTIGYSDEIYTTAWRDDYGSTTEWGIRIPAGLRNPLRSLNAVQFFLAVQGYYTLNIYYGDTIDAGTLARTLLPDLTDAATGWVTVTLDDPLPLMGDKDLWITLRFNTSTRFPAAATFYTGVSDGTWYKLPQGWAPFDQNGVYWTWMIRALFSERPCRVAVENAAYCDLQSFSGAGDYAVGETVTVSCSDPGFRRWEGIDGAGSSITFTVTGDTTFRALCDEVGIDEVEDSDPDLPVVVYDLMGRRRYERELPAGVYLMRIGTRMEKKVVIKH